MKEVEKQHGKSFEDYVKDRDGFDLLPVILLRCNKTDTDYNYWMRAQDIFDDWVVNEEINEQPQQTAPSKEIDWEQRRYETAREIYLRLIFAPQENLVFTPKAKVHAVSAVELAEILINELKKNKEEQS